MEEEAAAHAAASAAAATGAAREAAGAQQRGNGGGGSDEDLRVAAEFGMMLMERNAELKARVQELEEAVRDADLGRANFVLQVRRLEASVRGREADLEEAESRAAALETELASFREANKQVRTRLAVAENRSAEAWESLRAEADAASGLRHQVASSQADAKRWAERAHALETELSGVLAELAEVSPLRGEMVRRVEAERRAQEAEQLVAELQEETDRAVAEMREADERSRRAADELARDRALYESVRRELAALKAEVAGPSGPNVVGGGDSSFLSLADELQDAEEHDASPVPFLRGRPAEWEAGIGSDSSDDGGENTAARYVTGEAARDAAEPSAASGAAAAGIVTATAAAATAAAAEAGVGAAAAAAAPGAATTAARERKLSGVTVGELDGLLLSAPLPETGDAGAHAGATGGGALLSKRRSPQEEFFFINVLAVKVEMSKTVRLRSRRSTHTLYQQACEAGVKFWEVRDWIERQLMTEYLESHPIAPRGRRRGGEGAGEEARAAAATTTSPGAGTAAPAALVGMERISRAIAAARSLVSAVPNLLAQITGGYPSDGASSQVRRSATGDSLDGVARGGWSSSTVALSPTSAVVTASGPERPSPVASATGRSPKAADESDADFFERFCASQGQSWSQQELVRVAWIVQVPEGRAKSKDMAFNRIQQHVSESDFHATAVYFWCTMVRLWLNRDHEHDIHNVARGSTFASFRARHPEAGNPDLLRKYYSAQLLNSAEAAAHFLVPDRAPLPTK